MRAVSNKFYLINGSRSNDWKLKAFWRQKKSQLGTYRIQEDVSLSLLYWEFSSSEVVPVSKEGILRFLGRCQGTRTSWDLNCKRQRMLLDRRIYMTRRRRRRRFFRLQPFTLYRFLLLMFCLLSSVFLRTEAVVDMSTSVKSSSIFQLIIRWGIRCNQGPILLKASLHSSL